MPPPLPPLPSSLRHSPPPYSPLTYFRLLWSHPSHRPLLLRSLSHLPPPHTPSDNLLYEEALLQVAIAARCTSESHTFRLEQIGVCATAIAVGGVSDWAGGLLMACARAADIVGGKAGSLVSGRICKVIQGWGEGLGVRTFVGALEIGLVLDGFGTLPKEQMGLVMRAVVEGLERGEEWGDLALTVLGKGVWEDMVMVVDVVGGGWRKVLEAVESRMNHGQVGEVCVAVLGYLAEREGIDGGRARAALYRCLEMDSVRFCGGGSGSSRRGEEWGVLVEGMKMAGRVGGGGSFVGALEAMVWQGNPLGTELVYEAFIAVPGLRRRVINGLQVGLCGGKKSVAELFCRLLEALCAGAIGARDVGEEIVALLDGVGRMPGGVDCKVMKAIAMFAGVVPSLADRVWGYLRKGVGSRVCRTQFLVCSGLLAMIEVGVGDEAVPLLQNIFNRADARVRRHVMELIIRLNRESAGKMDEIISLIDTILKSMVALKTSDNRDSISAKSDEDISAAFNFWRCFEEAGGTWLVRDDLSISLKFCKELSVGVAETGKFSSQLMEYMQDISLGVYDACQSREDVAPVRMRIKQLCSIFETVSCIEFECVSNAHVSAYAIALLVRNYLAAQSSSSKIQSDTEVTYRPMDRSTDLHPLALLTIEEASALKRNDTEREEENDGLLPLLDYLGALRVLCRAISLPRLIVQAELLSSFVKRLQSEVRQHRLVLMNSEDTSSLMHLVRSSFMASGPWVSPIWFGNDSERTEGDRINRKTTANTQDERHEPDERQSNRSPGLFETSCATIRGSSLGEDVKKAVSRKQLEKISETTQLVIRQDMLQVVLFLLSRRVTSMEWIELLSFLKDVPVQDESGTRSAPKLRSKSDAAVEKCSEVQIVTGLSRLFRLEFDRSLSISLTLSYLDIYDFVVDKVDKSSRVGQMIQDIALSTMKSLLQDYSIRHVRVLRRMTGLILKSSAVEAALEYSADIVAWLGNESCLLNSDYAAKEDGVSAIGTEDFDMDIMEEAIRMDAEREDEETARIAPAEDESITEPGLDSTDSNRNNETRLGTDIRKVRRGADPVKSLCFNETTEGALVAIDCILSYCGKQLRNISDQFKRGKRDSLEVVKNHQEKVAGALNVFRQFLCTPFGDIKSRKLLRMPVAMQRKIISLFQSLLEIAETMLRTLMKAERDSTNRVDTRGITSVCERILELLFDDEIIPGNLASLCVAIPEHQGTRLTLLQERMDSTCTSILLSVNGSADKHWKTLFKLLRQRVNKIHQTPKRNLETPNPASSWTATKQRKSKRQRLRSRNKYVDGWLHEECGDDNYADLEDFIVPVDATDL